MTDPKTTMAFFVGLMIGATLGALMSPEKGAELRSDLKKKIGKTLKETGDEVVKSVKRGLEDITGMGSKTEEGTSSI